MPRTVGTQPTGYVVRVTLSGGTKTHQSFVTVHNRRTLEYKVYKADQNGVVANLADLSSDGTSKGTFSGFTNNDEIEVRCHGGRMGSGSLTVDTGGTRKGGGQVTVTVSDVTSTNVPTVSV